MPPPLPSAEAVGRLLGALIGRSPKILETKPIVVASVSAVAPYVDATGVIRYVAAADLPFVATVGAALALIPLAVAEEAIRKGHPGVALAENAYEVLNVAASLINDLYAREAHVKVTKLELAPNIRVDLPTFLREPLGRRDLEVTVPGYPVGRLSILSIV